MRVGSVGLVRAVGSVLFGVLIAALSWAQQPTPVIRDSEHLVPEAVQTGIVINIPQRMLFLKQSGEAIASYPVGLGRPSWPTFVGSFTIVALEVDPVWDVPVSIQEEQRRVGKPVLTRVGPGPANPLGKYWIGLSAAGYGIHGTTAPASISRFETHGCIRLRADDIADLFARVSVGMTGEIVYEPVLLHVADGGIRLEAHKDIYRRRGADEEAHVLEAAERAGVEHAIDWQAVRVVLATRDGRPHPVGTR